MLHLKRMIVGGALLPLISGLGLSACGASRSPSNTAKSGGQSLATPVSGKSCGVIPTRLPHDAALAKLPTSVQAAYNLFPGSVSASAWAHWKPNSAPPYTIAESGAEQTNPYAVELDAELNKDQRDSHGLVKPIVYQSSNNSAQTQIAQLQADIRDKVSLIIVGEESPAADAAVLKAAGKAGIPSIAFLSPATNPYMIGIDANSELQGAVVAQGLAKIMGDKGSVLEMQGVPGIPSSDQPLQGAGIVLKTCPNIKIVGSLASEYSPAVAKTATLEFLAAHPQPINGVIDVGEGAVGIIPAFEQAGKPVPPVASYGSQPGALAYWNEHKSTYRDVTTGQPTAPTADAVWQIAAGLLEGRGLKINDIEQAPILVTNANLNQWVEPGWSLQTTLGAAPGPPGVYMPRSYLNQFFAHPAK